MNREEQLEKLEGIREIMIARVDDLKERINTETGRDKKYVEDSIKILEKSLRTVDQPKILIPLRSLDWTLLFYNISAVLPM